MGKGAVGQTDDEILMDEDALDRMLDETTVSRFTVPRGSLGLLCLSTSRLCFLEQARVLERHRCPVGKGRGNTNILAVEDPASPVTGPQRADHATMCGQGKAQHGTVRYLLDTRKNLRVVCDLGISESVGGNDGPPFRRRAPAHPRSGGKHEGRGRVGPHVGHRVTRFGQRHEIAVCRIQAKQPYHPYLEKRQDTFHDALGHLLLIKRLDNGTLNGCEAFRRLPPVLHVPVQASLLQQHGRLVGEESHVAKFPFVEYATGDIPHRQHSDDTIANRQGNTRDGPIFHSGGRDAQLFRQPDSAIIEEVRGPNQLTLGHGETNHAFPDVIQDVRRFLQCLRLAGGDELTQLLRAVIQDTKRDGAGWEEPPD